MDVGDHDSKYVGTYPVSFTLFLFLNFYSIFDDRFH